MVQFFKSNWKHVTVIGNIILITMIYFNLQFQGYGLKQHDIEQFGGASHEIQDFREHTGKETLWTNSMFGGMPSTQISVLYEGNYIKNAIDGFIRLVPPPAGVAMLYMIGFYILMLCLNINPWVGLLGAIAFGFSSYDIIIIQAGHNTKALAVAFMAPVVGAFIMAYQRNIKWGIILSAVFMVIELSMNHLQVTYYLGILLVCLGIVMLVNAILKKELKNFFFASAGIGVAYVLALLVNYGNISMTTDYAKHTIRGGNDVTISPNGSSNAENSTSGLDKDYITQWSYGVGESFTLISPYVKGGGSVALAESPFAEDVDKVDLTPEQRKSVMNSPVYWGEQPMTSGPVYIGIIVVFLAVLGIVFLANPVKWALLVVTLLTLALSWGKNFMGLTDFFLDHVPGYNKFRAVTIILVMVELCVPVLGVLFLDLLIKEREQFKAKKKQFLIVAGVFVVFLLGIKAIGLGDGYSSTNDQLQVQNVEKSIREQIMGMDPNVLMSQYKLDVNNADQVNQFVQQQSVPYVEGFEGIKKVREAIFNDSMNRSLLFTILALGLLAALFYTEMKAELIVIGLVALTAMDLIPVAKNYLGDQEQGNGYKYWTERGQTLYPMEASVADRNIMENELAQNPALRGLISKAETEGVSKAMELELSGAAKTRVIDAYKFAALNRNTNYRVFDMSGGFNSANSSYFHKALGGYHGAKLRNIQNIFDFHLTSSNYKVYDMMNVKYFISNGSQVQPNPSALGNAWFVTSIRKVANPNDEIRSLGSELALENAFQGTLLVNGVATAKGKAYSSDKIQYVLKSDTIAVPMSNGLTEGMEAMFVMDINGKTNLVPIQTLELDTAKSFLKLVKIKNAKEFKPNQEALVLNDEFAKVGKMKFDGQGTIKMTSYAPNKITYSSNTKSEQFAVFSEVYYPEGWKATIDGKEVEIAKTDYLLRGLKIPAGKHTVTFEFDLPKYHTSGTLASISSILILLALAGGIYTDRRKKKEERSSVSSK
jgi:hypothetical protein